MVHNYTLRPENVAIKQVLDSGVIGRPEVVTLNCLGVVEGSGAANNPPGWRRDARIAGGGVLLDMIHAVYLVAWLMGEPIRAVSAALARRRPGTVEDLALCRFEFETGFGLVNMAWGQGPGGVEIMGTEGRLLLFYRDFGTSPFTVPEQLHVFRGGERVPVETAFPTDREAVPPTIRLVVRNFARAVAGLEAPIATGEQGCLALEAVVGAYASAARQRTVRLPLDPDDAVYQRGLAALWEAEATVSGG
jgi:predicted dehydrogenase